jgi:O-antigen ligase
MKVLELHTYQYFKKVGVILLIIATFSPFLAYFVKTLGDLSFPYLLNIFLYLSAFLVFVFYYGKVSFPNYLIYYTLFVVYTIISDFGIVDKPFDFKYLYTNQMIGSILMFFFIENGRYEETTVNKYMKYNLYILFVAFVVILIQQAVNHRFLVYDQWVEGYTYSAAESEIRLPSIYSYMDSSLNAGFSFVGILAIILANRIRENRSLLHLLVLFTAGAIYCFLTKYRWIMLNFLVLFFLFYIYKNFRTKRFLSFTFSIILALVMIYNVALAINIPVDKFINERILERTSGGLEHSAAGTRVLAANVFLKLFPDNPVFGVGQRLWDYGSTGDQALTSALHGRSSQMHVGYLTLLYNYGIVGAIPFVLFLIAITKKLYKDSKLHNNWGVFLGFLGFTISNLTLVNFNLLLSGIIILLAYNNSLLQKAAYENQ